LSTSPEALIEAARSVRDRAHAPYSHFAVGAAILTATGEIFSGCNVENASFGLTICAERNAIAAAVAAGHVEYIAIAIVSRGAATPCGACRQVLREFSEDLTIHMADASGPIQTTDLGALLPQSFASFDPSPDIE
jgi:cytidine deaminase